MLSDESDTEDVQLTINEHYAKAFEYRKEREELERLKEKYGSDGEGEEDSEDSEDLETEDEDGEELTPAVDAAILRTLARIKRKDPSIYEQGKSVFEEETKKVGKVTVSSRPSKDKSKPVTIRQLALASALHPESRSPSPEPLTHVQEQQALRQETIAAFHTGDTDDSDDDLLVPREKTKDEEEREEEEYKEFLEREVGEDLKGLITVEDGDIIDVNDNDEAEGSTHEKKSGKKSKKSKKSGKTKQEEDQEFLLDYIVNRGWLDRSAKRLPTYKEITGSSRAKGKGRADSGADDSDAQDEVDPVGAEDLDEEFDEVADRFESSYNFRFEEPGADQITRYPRNIDSLVRREDSSRKEAREKRKARKEEELLKKKEEVKRLKSLKMKEVRAKLERIGREGGKRLEETEALQELDLDGDWDPEAHDNQMSKIYGQDEDGSLDDEKPQWDDDIDIADIAPDEEDEPDRKKKKKKKKKEKAKDAEYEGGVDVDEMDADVEKVLDEEEWDGTEEMRKKKLEEYMDEIYGLEFNDVVAGMPTRFKYAKVQPQSYALTPAEILLATDAELNQYMGIKKYAPYRKEGQNWDQARSARLHELKTKLAERRAALEGRGEFAVSAPPEKPVKKRKGKKERLREKAVEEGEAQDDEDKIAKTPAEAEEAGKRKRREEVASEPAEDSVDDEQRSKKKRRRHKKAGQKESVPS